MTRVYFHANCQVCNQPLLVPIAMLGKRIECGKCREVEQLGKVISSFRPQSGCSYPEASRSSIKQPAQSCLISKESQ